MSIALAIGTIIAAIAAVLLVTPLITVAVLVVRDLRATRYTKREVARGAVEFYPPERLTLPETDLDRIIRETYEGARPVRRVQR